MYLDTENLRWRMLNVSDDELLHIVTTCRAQYRPEVIDLASQELMQRNIPLPTINYPQLNTAAHLTCSQQPEPEKKSTDHPIYWLIATVLAIGLIVIDEQFIKPLLHKNQLIRSIIKWFMTPFVIYRLYKFYKWYKSED